ncbi:hypothetical protein B0H14DRAFT_3459398 [Mycena olivaceomarginata]|nr:hypothetical protein B0H14DRAFT_3459398 [Mycena olivaceomarginata]
MTRDHTILGSLLQEARRDYLAAKEHKMSNNWRHVACREKRSMHSIILDPGVKNILIDEAKGFLLSKECTVPRVLARPPSGLDVYIISLSRVGLDDSALGELVNDLPEGCVVLMEDIDVAFTSGPN